MEPLVSIVLPVYNAQDHLGPCLDALLAQCCDDLEVIAVDDGSTDRSSAMLDDFVQAHPDRFQVLHTLNGGVWRARKVGIAAARGCFVGFCDSDDLPMPDMYVKLLARAEETGAGMTVCPFWRIDAESGMTLSVEMAQFGDAVLSVREDPGFLPVINTALWNKLFMKSLLDRAIEFDTPPRVLEDMMLQCSVYPECDKVAFLSEPLYRYLTRKGSAMFSVRTEELGTLTDAMIQTRAFVINRTEDGRFRAICDLMAFIHFGLSIPTRLVRSKGKSFRAIIREIQCILDEHFPLYRNNPFCTLHYNRTHQNRMLKPMLALWCYRLRLAGPFMEFYRFASKVLHIEIKW